MGVQCISIFGDSELIIRQIKNHCQTKHPRLRSYRNEFWNLIEKYFEAFNIHCILREQNRLADSLAVVASTFKPPVSVGIFIPPSVIKILLLHCILGVSLVSCIPFRSMDHLTVVDFIHFPSCPLPTSPFSFIKIIFTHFLSLNL